jgi:hypothetical protein
VGFWSGFLVPFLGSIFAPFLAKSLRAICLFYGVSCPSKVVFGPFSDVFWTVLLVTILSTFHQSGVRVLTLGLLKVLHVLVFTLGVMDWCSPSTNNKALRGSSPLTLVVFGQFLVNFPRLGSCFVLLFGRSSADFTLVRVAA